MVHDEENPLAPKQLYILVADSSMARLFQAKTPVRSIEELMDQANLPGRQKDSELYSDRPGSDHGGVGGYQSYDRETTDRPEDVRFARDLAEHLEKARHEGQFDNLVLIAPPHFLGILRNQLSKDCQGAVLESIDKDLVRQDVAAITRHVDGL